jgi:DNA-binding NarL/FixJ family response regulator
MRILEERFDVIAVVAEGHTLVELASQLEPDAIVADVRLEGLDRISASRQIRQKCAVTPIVLMPGDEDPDLQPEALAAGASVFLTKRAALSTLVSVLDSLLRVI